MKNLEAAHEAVDQALKVIEETNLHDFTRIAKVWARKGSVWLNSKDYHKAIECF